MSRAGLLVLLLSSSVPAADWAQYPGAKLTPIGGQLAYFTTRDSVAVVAAYFSRVLSKGGFPTIVEGDLRDEGVVSAFHTQDGTQLAIVLRRDGKGTLAFLARKNLWATPPVPASRAVRLEGMLALGAETDDGAGHGDTQTTIARMDFEAASQEIALQWKGGKPVLGQPSRDHRRTRIWEERVGPREVGVALTELSPGWVALLETHREVSP
jgi:hypothetical protein